MAAEEVGPLRFAWRYLRTRGARAVLRGLVRRFLFARNSWIVTEGVLRDSPPEPSPDGIVFRRATTDDLARLEVLEPYRRAGELRARVRDEDCLLDVACDGPRIVAFRMVGRRPMRYFPLTRFLQLGEHDVFSHETFCHPDYRNRGVGRRLANASDRLLAGEGWKRRVSVIRADNVPSLRMAFGRGTRPVCHVSYVRVLFYHRWDVSKDLPVAVGDLLARATSRARLATER